MPTARLIPIISPGEAAELTYYGSEVVHPFTMEQVHILLVADYVIVNAYEQYQAIRKKISIRIKNVENPKGGGTVIHPDPDVDSPTVQQGIGLQDVPEPVSLALLHELSLAEDELKRSRMPTAVTIKEHIMILNVNSNRKNVSHGFFAGVFGTLDRFGVVVDLISTSEVHVSMAIEDNLNKKLLGRLVQELKKSGTVSLPLESLNRDLIVVSCGCILGLRSRRRMHPFSSGQAAKHGRYCGPHVYYTSARRCEHLHDQSRVE